MPIDFTKKFNVGLTLKTSLRTADKFFERYGSYINEVYFSAPLGNRFHTRRGIQQQLSKKRIIDKFWKLLGLVKSHGIRLEMVLNTNMLSEQDIESARDVLVKHNVDIDSVCCMEEYYDAVKRVFPGKDYICSFNNVFRSVADIQKVQNEYDSYVLGGALIRANDAFRCVREQKHAKVVLLLNNGCSFNCRGCRSAQHCKPVFMANLKKHSVDYLYALQSVLPPEIYDGSIDVDSVDYFKISNRSSKLSYLKKCMDSYMTNSTLKYLRRGFMNYSLWARMGHFWSRYIKIRRKKMLAYKAEILGHELELK
ncbi:MAG: hypothetical protein K2O04_01325 [Clostridiales bacterium]|nr:hypothetical protein [Clostridiales bacterium]